MPDTAVAKAPAIEMSETEHDSTTQTRGERPGLTAQIPDAVRAQLDEIGARVLGEQPAAKEEAAEPAEELPTPESVREKTRPDRPETEKKQRQSAVATTKKEKIAKVAPIIPDAVLEPPVEKTEDVTPEAEVPEHVQKQGEQKITQWKELHKSNEDRGREIESLKAKLKQQPTPDDTAAARIQELETRIAQMTPAFERVNLEAHPDFQRQFTVPENAMLKRGAELVEMAGLDKNLLTRALSQSGAGRIEAMDELTESITSPTLKAQVMNLVGQLENLQTEKAAVLRDSKAQLQQRRLAEQANAHRAQQAEAKELGTLFDSAVEHLRDKAGFELLRKSELPEHEDWNKEVDTRIAEARDLLMNNTDMAQSVAAAILAVQAPKYRDAYRSERAMRIDLEKRLAAIEGSEPDLKKGGGNMAPEPEVDLKEDIGKAGIRYLNERRAA